MLAWKSKFYVLMLESDSSAEVSQNLLMNYEHELRNTFCANLTGKVRQL